MYDKNIKVSVIVLTYSQKDYIKQALDSILKQKTTFAYEILVGDDASTDGTSDILRSYIESGNKSIRIFIREKNMGATANLVDLFQHSNGKYIASCEGDDYWSDEYKLQKQANFLDAHPQYIGCTHSVTLVQKNGIPCKNQKLKWILSKPQYQLKDFRGLFLPGHPVSLMHRNIFTGNSSMCDLISKVHRNVADRTIAMLLAANGDIAWSKEQMACYRYNPQKGSSNLTSAEFAAGANSKLMEFRLTNQLESYARVELRKHVSFNYFRINLLLRSLGKALLCGSREDFHCFIDMMKEWYEFYMHQARQSFQN